jgi:UDP-N-acetylglucosamine 4,6-dehydratase
MINNYIIGKRSNLSKNLKKILPNSILISLKEKKDVEKLFNEKKKHNIIFNNFYPVSRLNEISISNIDIFVNETITLSAFLLKRLNYKLVNKILYTSSSSVYDSMENREFSKDPFNRKLYASLKLSNEKLFLNTANKKKVQCHIIRLFNLYGGDDNFSIIQKIVNCHLFKKNFTLFNNGDGIRDFIHVTDVCKIYKSILDTKMNLPDHLDLGSGLGISIKSILDYTKFPKKKIIHKKNFFEETFSSIADINWLYKINYKNKFNSALEGFLQKKIKKRLNKRIFRFQKEKKNRIEANNEGVVIYGAGNAGKQIYKEFVKNKENILFFIDDDINLNNSSFNNVKIISYNYFKKIKNFYIINKIIFSIPSIKEQKEKMILNNLKKDNFDVRVIPSKKFLTSSILSLNDLRFLNLEQSINLENLKFDRINYFNNKKVLVTGGAGSIGSEICRQLVRQKCKKVFCLDNNEYGIYKIRDLSDKNRRIDMILGDVTNYDFLVNFFKNHKVDTVIHCAAYKHVNILENNLQQAIQNNTISTFNLCKVSLDYNADFLLISTDKAVEPASILGYSKRAAENVTRYLSAKNQKKIVNIVRFGNVIGSSGSAIPNFLNQINNNLPITITHKKASRYFMSINQACYLVLKTFDLKIRNKVFFLEMGKPIFIYNLVLKLINLKKKILPDYKPSIKISGLKKGEKLNEILYSDNKKNKTKNKMIYYLNEKKINLDKIEYNLNQLMFGINKLKDKSLKNFLKKISSLK